MLRVVIERHIKQGQEIAYQEAILKAKNHAHHVQGFISGEVLNNIDDSRHFLVLSTWDSIEGWNRWAKSQARHEILEMIRPMLEGDEKVTLMQNSQIVT